jgi:uncharacterized protein
LKLHPDQFIGVNAVTSLTEDAVVVGPSTYRHHALVPWVGPVCTWSAPNFAELTLEHFEQVRQLQPELVIFGSGARLRFPPPVLLLPFMAQRIGFECMDSGAACRTYNVLVGEGRRVVLALLIAANA